MELIVKVMSIMIVIKINRLIFNLNQCGSECTFRIVTFLWFPKLILGQDVIFCGSDCAKEDDSDDDKGTVDDDSSWVDDDSSWDDDEDE